MNNILIINGPNLNLLGKRKPEIYGNESLDDIMNWVSSLQQFKNCEFKFFQSNHEGNIIDSLHQSVNWANGILINAGALSHYSFAIRDAIEAIQIPTVEVHLSNIYEREDFRKNSVLTDVCVTSIYGLGKVSYSEALAFLLKNNLTKNNLTKDNLIKKNKSKTFNTTTYPEPERELLYS